MNTKGYGGSQLSKTIGVYTNDVKQPLVNLVVTGMVEKFATITPTRLIMRGLVNASVKGRVKIIPEKKYPFKILGIKAKNGKAIQFDLTDYREGAQEGFLLTVTNLRKEKGRYFDILTMETDSEIKPEITIGVHLIIEAE